MIYPKCKNNRQIYLAADGQVLPCCMVAGGENCSNRYYEKWHTKNNSIENIVKDIREWADNLEEGNSTPFNICNAECGKYSDVVEVTHIEASTRCILQCPKCPRTRALEIGTKIYIGDVNFEKTIELIDATENERVVITGSFGDAIFNPKLKDIVKHVISTGKCFTLATAAPGKDLKWWKDFYQLYTGYNNVVIFGLDGLEDTAGMYRVGTDFNKMFETMKLGAKMGKHVVWQWIPFSFNEHQIDTAKKLAKGNGIEFRIRLGDRWSGDDDPLKPKNLYKERGW